MLRLVAWTRKAVDSLVFDVEKRFQRIEKSDTTISGFTATYNAESGKLTLTKGDTVVSFSKD